MAERPPAYALLHIQPAQFHRYSENTKGDNEKLKKKNLCHLNPF